MATENPTTGCWEWSGIKLCARWPYGKVSVHGEYILTHRLAAFYVTGRWPRELVCHVCDNPPCLNPSHLFLGTHGDNAMDALAKCRLKNPPGEMCPCSILKNHQVLEARKYAKPWSKGNGVSAYARKFGVSSSAMLQAYHGATWPHLPSAAELRKSL